MNESINRAHLKAAQDRQKSYADKRRRPIEFQVGDFVLLKVSPWKGVIRFRKRGKLSPRFIGPFKIIARIGEVAYRLELPEELSGIHNTFHVSYLRKCLADESAYVPLEDLVIDDKLNYIEKPVAILDRKVKQLRNKTINQVMVQWKNSGVRMLRGSPRMKCGNFILFFLRCNEVSGTKPLCGGTKRHGKELVIEDSALEQGELVLVVSQ
ncbi:hypothetical protein E3N88_43174 [Mikania micrantha]|uniref:Tf2-1-like SH3-like domain-containing protein n=1 Tax=Mikania micrantha TaxID=192012 RepID=A0A5N6LFN3_9ASTR|nr:hypothetical protein E3N88_43174 [Mikania micrantha]